MNKKSLIAWTILPLLAVLILNTSEYIFIRQEIKHRNDSMTYLSDHCKYSAIAAAYGNRHAGGQDRYIERITNRERRRDSIFTSIIDQLRKNPSHTFGQSEMIKVYAQGKSRLLICHFDDDGANPFRYLYYLVERNKFILKDSCRNFYSPYEIVSCDGALKSDGGPLLAMSYSNSEHNYYARLYYIYDLNKKKIAFSDIKVYDDWNYDGSDYSDDEYPYDGEEDESDESSENEEPSIYEEENEDDDNNDNDGNQIHRTAYNNAYTFSPKYIDNYPILVRRQKRIERQGKSITKSESVNYYKIDKTGVYKEFQYNEAAEEQITSD